MRYFLAALVAAFVFLGTIVSTDYVRALSAISVDYVDSAMNATVRVGSSQRFGSGVIIDAEHGYILTAAHLFRQDEERRVKEVPITIRGDEEPLWASVVEIDFEKDVALLVLNEFPASLVDAPIRVSDPVVAEKIRMIGFPMGMAWTISFGNVAAYYPAARAGDVFGNSTSDAVDRGVIRMDISILPGSSGGGVFDDQGRLIGIAQSAIVWSMAGFDKSVTGFAQAVPIDTVCEVIQDWVPEGCESH